MKKRIAALALVLVFCLGGVAVPASASGLTGKDSGNFWTAIAQTYPDWFLGLPGKAAGALGFHCPEAPDSLHKGSVTGPSKKGFDCLCDYCGQTFTVDAAEISAIYDESFNGYKFDPNAGFSLSTYAWNYKTSNVSTLISSLNHSTMRVSYSTSSTTTSSSVQIVSSAFSLPVGFYEIMAPVPICTPASSFASVSRAFSLDFSSDGGRNWGKLVTFSGEWSGGVFSYSSSNPSSLVIPASLASGRIFRFSFMTPNLLFKDKIVSFVCENPVLTFTPESSLFPRVGEDGGGGDIQLGIKNQDGSFSMTSGIGTLFNEGQMTYYNPQTQNYQPVSNWKYDYSDRSYSFDTDGGKVGKVVYGDDVASVTLTDSDGNTITYNYYYMVDSNGVGGGGGGGTVNPSPSPGPGGSTGNSNSNNSNNDGSWFGDVIINIGDIIGNILGGPGGGSGGEGGEESGGGFFGWLGGKLGELLGAIGGGFLSLIQKALGTVLDGLIYIVTMITEKLGTVVDTLLSVLDEIPGIFEGFTGFLEQVFSFFPPEIVTIITFGILMMVLVTVIKHFLG